VACQHHVVRGCRDLVVESDADRHVLD
jgi:hypothetical protein